MKPTQGTLFVKNFLTISRADKRHHGLGDLNVRNKQPLS